MQLGLEMEEFLFDEIFAELTGEAIEEPFNRRLLDWGGAYSSHIGLQRGRNEDRIAVAHLEAKRSALRCAIVCDGVGGTENGHLASSIAISAFLSHMASSELNRSLRSEISSAIRYADEAVRARLNGSGATTLSVFCTSSDGELTAANVGDSRIYSWNGRKGAFQQQSVDDTLENELKYLNISNPAVLDVKGLRRSLSQAIGEKNRRSEELRINFLSGRDFENGVVLATDGLWAGGEDSFLSIGRNAHSAQVLVRRAIAYSLWSGGADNASIIAIQDVAKFFPPKPIARSRASSRVQVWIGDEKFSVVVPARQLGKGVVPAEIAQAKPRSKKSRPKLQKNSNPVEQTSFLASSKSEEEVWFSSDKEGDE